MVQHTQNVQKLPSPQNYEIRFQKPEEFVFSIPFLISGYIQQCSQKNYQFLRSKLSSHELIFFF